MRPSVFLGLNALMMARQPKEDDEAVGHIREHEAEEEHIPEEVQRVGVDAVIGGERIHLRHHIDAVHPLGVLQLGGYGVVLFRVDGLPCAGKARRAASENVRHPFGGDPALGEEDAAVGHEPLGHRLAADVLIDAVLRTAGAFPARGAFRATMALHLLLALRRSVRRISARSFSLVLPPQFRP